MPTVSARIRRSTNQTIPHAAGTTLTFDTVVWDDGFSWNPATQPDRLVFPEDGTYVLEAGTIFAASGSGLRLLALFVNGVTEIVHLENLPPGGGANAGYFCVGLWRFTAGQYITAKVRQDSGAPLDILALAHHSLFLAATKHALTI